MDRLKDKVALITGGARGQGREMAELFMREGATAVYAADVLEPEGVAGSPVTFVKLDVTKDAEWKALTQRIVDEQARLDILVNNAAIYLIEPILETTDEIYDRILDVNLKSLFLGMRAVLPHMVSRRQGSIINVSSIWGLAGVPVAFAYQVAKGAILNMSKNVALAHGENGIRCNSLHPGYIITPMNRDQPQEISDALVAGTAMKRGGQPIETAYAALFLASDEASYITGTSLVVDGGYLAP